MELTLAAAKVLPKNSSKATLIGRVWRPDIEGPSVVILRDGNLIDIRGGVIAVRKGDKKRCFIGGREGADKRRDVEVVYAAVTVHVAEQHLGQADRIQ